MTVHRKERGGVWEVTKPIHTIFISLCSFPFRRQINFQFPLPFPLEYYCCLVYLRRRAVSKTDQQQQQGAVDEFWRKASPSSSTSSQRDSMSPHETQSKEVEERLFTFNKTSLLLFCSRIQLEFFSKNGKTAPDLDIR